MGYNFISDEQHKLYDKLVNELIQEQIRRNIRINETYKKKKINKQAISDWIIIDYMESYKKKLW